MDGLRLFGCQVAYLVWALVSSRKESAPIQQEYETEYGPIEKTFSWSGLIRNLIFLVLGLTFLVFRARWFVESAVVLAKLMGLSELVIGLTIVALGTSLPEVATSVVAAIKGERDIAVAIACLPIFFTGSVITRANGVLFFAYYCAYTVALLLTALGNGWSPTFNFFLLWFALPLTFLGLAAAVWWEWKILRKQRSAAQELEQASAVETPPIEES